MTQILHTPAERCTGCGTCAAACPKSCIRMAPDQNGFLRPAISEQQCIRCGKCAAVCPAGKQRVPQNDQAFAASALEEDVRRVSSSGGVFTVLARQVLEEGGVVFGAAFAEAFTQVCHTAAHTEVELSPLRGSKYIQSDASDGIRQAMEALKQKKTVLFVGTPCQVAGLRSVVGEDPKLIAAEVICHGVASPKAWAWHLAELEKHARSPITSVSFRDKTRGWQDYRLCVGYLNGKKKLKSRAVDPFLRGYNSNLFLRDTCYDCPFKSGSSGADLTLGDFWGLRRLYPELDDDRGTSLVLIRSDRGRQLWARVCGQLWVTPVETDAAMRHNPAAWSSAKRNPKRDEFFAALDREPLAKLVGRLCPMTKKARLKAWIPTRLKRLLRR